LIDLNAVMEQFYDPETVMDNICTKTLISITMNNY